MFSFFSLQALIILMVYCFIILAFFAGWTRLRKSGPASKKPPVKVSILIPCKNEASNIEELSEILNNQNYAGSLEIIWINDHSEDSTAAVLNSISGSSRQNLTICLGSEASGKKAALRAGATAAKGDLILLTDADSRPGKNWVSTMSACFSEQGYDLILGPVVLDPAMTVFAKMQKLEFMSLVASSAGAAGLGHPVMAQGPNIGIRSSDYQTIVMKLKDRYISGDDMFLLEGMKRIPGKKTGFLLNRDAIVRTKPAATFSGFLRQRRRWASKAKGYSDPYMIFISLLVFLANLEIAVALVCACLGKITWVLPLVLFSMKTMADLPLLISSARFFQSLRLFRWIVQVQLLYPFYITLTGTISQFGRVIWKK